MTTETTSRKYAAQLVFTERVWGTGDRGLPGWDGRLLSPEAQDRQTGKPAANYLARIDYAPAGRPWTPEYMDGYGQPAELLGHCPDGTAVYASYPYRVTMQGSSKYARRVWHVATLEAAQAALAAWASRRFFVEA